MPVAADPILKLQNVSFHYRRSDPGAEAGLHDISFELFTGETLGVIGRNGAGKSSLLRLLAGVVEPDKGVLQRAPDVRCGLLSLGVGFMPDLTGIDNIVVALILQGIPEAEARSRLPAIAEFSELGDALHQRVRTYSAGMRSRLMFSSALYAETDVLLIDEVLAVGDGAFRNKAQAALIKKMSSDQTVVYVSHSDHTVKRLCDRVLWMENGRLKMLGDANLVVASYQGNA